MSINNVNLSEDPSIPCSLTMVSDDTSFQGLDGVNSNNDRGLLNQITNTRGFKIAALNINSLPAHLLKIIQEF